MKASNAALSVVCILVASHLFASDVRIRSFNALPRSLGPMQQGPIPSGSNPQSYHAPANLGGVPYRPLGSQSPSRSAYVPEAWHFRIVDGQLYNIILSSNWHDLWEWTGTPFGQFRVSSKGYDSVIGNWVAVDCFKMDVQTGDHNLLKTVLVKNCGHPENLAVGESFSANSRVMLVGNVETYDGRKLEVYDSGLPNTPENRAALHPSLKTNLPPARTSTATTRGLN